MTCYCSPQCSKRGYKHRIKERKMELRHIQEMQELRSCLVRRADIELMLKSKPYERLVAKNDFNISDKSIIPSSISTYLKHRNRKAKRNTIPSRRLWKNSNSPVTLFTAFCNSIRSTARRTDGSSDS